MCHARKCHQCKSVILVVSVTYVDLPRNGERAADAGVLTFRQQYRYISANS
jgi:hypothetical protein